jgi:hypothetical protein
MPDRGRRGAAAARGEGGRVCHSAGRPGSRIRCYLRDPDGYLIEVGQSTGLLHVPVHVVVGTSSVAAAMSACLRVTRDG